MDNAQKALQIAFSVFLFIIAVTTGIFLYSTMMINTQEIFKNSDEMTSSAEQAVFNDEFDYNRKISKQEVIMTILDIDNNKSYLDSIVVKNSNGTSNKIVTSRDLNYNTVTDNYYYASYVYENGKVKTLTYKNTK